MTSTCIYEFIPVDKKYSSLEEGYGCIIPGYSTVTPVVHGTLTDKMKPYYLYASTYDEEVRLKTVTICENQKVNVNELKSPNSYTITESGDELNYRFELPDVLVPTHYFSPVYHEYEPLIAYISAANEKNTLNESGKCITKLALYGEPRIKVVKNPYESNADGTAKKGGSYRTAQVQVGWFPINVSGAAKKVDKITLSGKIKRSNESVYKPTNITTKLIKTDTDTSGWVTSTYDVTVAVNKSYTHNFALYASDGLGGDGVSHMFFQSAFKLFDFRVTGRGFALGKPSERDAFECDLDLVVTKGAEFKRETVFRGPVRGHRNGVVIIDIEIAKNSVLMDSARFPGAKYIFELALPRDMVGEQIDEKWLPELYPEKICPELYPICALETNTESGLYEQSANDIYLKVYLTREPKEDIRINCKFTKSMSLEAQNAAGGN